MEKGEQLKKLVSGGSQEVFMVLYVDFTALTFVSFSQSHRDNCNLELPNYH